MFGSCSPGDSIAIEASFVGFTGLPSCETRGSFGDNSSTGGLAIVSFPDIFEEVEDL